MYLVQHQLLKTDGWRERNPHSTWLRRVRDHSRRNAWVRKTYQMLWSAALEMKSEDWGVVLARVTAGVVLLWRTRRSALPLRLVINGYRFITGSQSAMLPARPMLLVTQSGWLMHTNTHKVYTNLRNTNQKLLRYFRHSYDSYFGLTNVLSFCLLPLLFLVLSIQRTSSSSRGKIRRTLSSTACLPLQGMYYTSVKQPTWELGIYCSNFNGTLESVHVFKCWCQYGFRREELGASSGWRVPIEIAHSENKNALSHWYWLTNPSTPADIFKLSRATLQDRKNLLSF